VVSKLVKEMGVPLAAGESIEFIIIDQSGKKRPEKAKPLALYAFEDGYDIEQYTEFALKAAETLLLPLGYDLEALKEYLGLSAPVQPKTSRAPRILRLPHASAQQIPLFRTRAHPQLKP
jgi:DNA polymerase elongation subunit (family B)